jgi:tetratricopeptide (TPR) repeat protein
MTRAIRWSIAIVLAALAGIAGYRIVALRLADQWAATSPARALQWSPRHPLALLTLAEQQLDRGQHQQAGATARRLLAAEPLEGRAWRVLAQAEAAQGDAAAAERLFRIAVRRAPRDRAARIALLQADLQAQRWLDATGHLDVLLRIAPRQAEPLFPVLIELAAIEPVAEDIASRLKVDPPWRPGLVRTLQADPTSPGAQALLGAMGRQGLLEPGERAAWLTGLMQQGRWGEAYARWASDPAVRGRRLEPVFNGGFDQPPAAGGFDWRLAPPPGVDIGIEAPPGSDGPAAHLAFNGRRVAAVGLDQTLLLAPGPHRLAFRARTEGLQSDRGLEWAIGCEGQGASLAVSPPLRELPEWAMLAVDVDIPAEHCPAQWLRLRNVATAPPLQRVTGELWLDDIRIVRRPSSLAAPGTGR